MKHKNKGLIGYGIKMVVDLWRICPISMFFFSLADLLHAMSYVLVMITMQKFFDVLAIFAAGGEYKTVLMPFIKYFLAIIFAEIINGVANYPTEVVSPRFIAYLTGKVQEKASNIEPVMYHDSKFLDLFEKVNGNIEKCARTTVLLWTIIVFYVPYYIFTMIYMGSFTMKLFAILPLIFIPEIIYQTIKARKTDELEESISESERKLLYYERAMCEPDSLKEVRSLGCNHFFLNLLHDNVKKIVAGRRNFENRQIKYEVMASAVSVIGYIGVLIILIAELSKNNISVSVFAAVFTSMDTMYGMANEIFGWIWKRAAGNMSFIKNFYLLMDIDEKNSSETNSNDIVFENVSFSYPEADNICLKNISIRIKQGEKVAIVGENGAGKSTLAKLMLGIYKPDNGKVYLPYKRSAVFQDFNKYKFSLEDNIRISDTRDEKNIDDICKELNININKNEILSKEFGGTDLSGGQWQKIAIGRGLYRENEMIILDEPTAAIDPIEEKNIYDEFLNIANTRTTVIITHRIGAARLADRIIVLESGQICEEGTHEELMNKNGKYCTMFSEQSK